MTGAPSEAQVKFLTGMLTKKKWSLDQWAALLSKVGVTGDLVAMSDVAQVADKGQVSKMIELVKDGWTPDPTYVSDVPNEWAA